jgi:hypothetical protein
MDQPNFRVLEMRISSAKDWLDYWAVRYDDDETDEKEYLELITHCAAFSGDDIRRIGRWKDGASKGRWKPNVASVAYLTWERVADDPPKCPSRDEVKGFLEKWSEAEYIDEFKTRTVKKHFGLSRATTLLHFVSGGKYPIFDSRVRAAIARLGYKEPGYTLNDYLELLELFNELASLCKTEDTRKLDKALFAYAAIDGVLFSIP